MFETEIVREIEQKQQEWEETTVKEYVKDFPEKEILSDIPRRRLYTPNDLVDFDYMKDLGFPGEEPFTRGKFPTMYRSRVWTEWLY
jgi:methylmalonyl-CoA mutase N-terminal domain/subunit